MKHLILIRHAQAADQAPTDAERSLTEAGIATCVNLAKSFDELFEHFDFPGKIYHSPYVRARQTASYMMENSQYNGELVQTEHLLGENKPADVASWLESTNEKFIVCVTHYPLVSTLMSYLDEGKTDFAEMHPKFSMGTASIAMLRAEVFSQGTAETTGVAHHRIEDAL